MTDFNLLEPGKQICHPGRNRHQNHLLAESVQSVTNKQSKQNIMTDFNLLEPGKQICHPGRSSKTWRMDAEEDQRQVQVVNRRLHQFANKLKLVLIHHQLKFHLDTKVTRDDDKQMVRRINFMIHAVFKLVLVLVDK